jgi:hypothetical protein
MQRNRGAPFGLKVVPHYAAGVGDLELSRCAVFKALDTMPSLGHGVWPRSESPTLLEVSCLSLQSVRQLSLSGFGCLLRLSFAT